MDAIEVTLERAIYGDNVVMRIAHRYTSDFFANIRTEGSRWIVCLTPKSAQVRTEHLVERFQTDALDEGLRERIRAETAEIHTALVRTALREALSPERESTT